MKILNLIQSYPPAIGGTETWCKNLCSFLASKGIFTKVLTINTCNTREAFHSPNPESIFIKLGKYDYDEGVFIKRCNLWALPNKGLLGKIIIPLLRLCKTQIGDIFIHSPHSLDMYKDLFSEIKKTDIVILHTLPYFYNLLGYMLARLYKKTIISVPYFHPGHPHYERNLFYKIMNNCDLIIALSEYEKRHLVAKKINPSKILVSGSAIDVKKSYYQELRITDLKMILNKHNINEHSKKVIFIGRKELYKGIFTLIEAMRKLAAEKDIDLYLFLAGPDTPEFIEEYSKLDNIGRLKIINFGEILEEEKDYLLKLSDLLVLPSEFESFGIVFLEAWKHEKPVIGTDRGAVPEIIGKAGLCAEYNNADDLKNKIKEILFNADLARKFGKIGKEKVECEYNIDKVCNKVSVFLNNSQNGRKKVLIVSLLFPPNALGGSEIVAYEQGKNLKQAGFEVRVFTGKLDEKMRRFKAIKEKKEFCITRIILHNRDFNHYKYANFDKKELSEEFRKELHEYAPDIVHFHNMFALSLSMIDDCIQLKIPVVLTLHDYWGICPRNLLIKEDGSLCDEKDARCLMCHGNLILEDGATISLQERNLQIMRYYNKVNLLISPSRYLSEKYTERGLDRETIKVISNGIETGVFKKYKKTKSNILRFGYVGQIIWHKGIENLLKSMDFLTTLEKNKMSLLIVGSGEEIFLDYCKQSAKKINFIKFLGKINHKDMPKIFSSIDILIVPSIWPENLPCTILEAMASGTPVIASDLGGIPELIDDGINGFLFKHDDPGSLADKIRGVINDPAKIQKMREACFKKAEENDIAKKIKIISDSYRKILDTI